MKKPLIIIPLLLLTACAPIPSPPTEEEAVPVAEEVTEPSEAIISFENGVAEFGGTEVEEYFNKIESNFEHVEFNSDPPTTTVPYANEKIGIAFDVPYNPKWAPKWLKMNAYDERTDSDNVYVDFGPLSFPDYLTNSLYRNYRFEAVEAIPADQLINNLKSEAEEYFYSFEVAPNATRINGLQVVKYKNDGVCPWEYLVLIGRNYNYEFSAMCYSSEEPFEFLKTVVKSVKFLDKEAEIIYEDPVGTPCNISSGKKGFVMFNKKCYLPGENVPETDCIVSATGGCESLDY